MVFVEFRELCRYAQKYRGDIVFYDKFAYLCKQKGVSPSRAAIEAGVSKSLVTKWKSNNTQVPSADVVKRLAKYFGTSIAELLGEENKNLPTKFDEHTIDMSDVDIAFYGGYKELSEDDQKTIRDMVALMRQRRANKEETK